MTHHPTLRGEFVALRPLLESDAELTLAWRRSPRAVHLNAGAATIEDQARWIQTRPETEYNFMIERLDGRPVGMLSLIDVSLEHRRAEPSRFLIGDEEAVRGIPAAVEAMLLLYEFAFDALGLVRMYGTIAEANILMVKWQKYLGMEEEGRLRNHYFLDGKFQDAICLGLLEERYRKVSLPRMKALIAAGRSRRSE